MSHPSPMEMAREDAGADGTKPVAVVEPPKAVVDEAITAGPKSLVHTGPLPEPAAQGAPAPVYGIVWTPEKKAVLIDLIMQGATETELEMFIMVCSRAGLDPFARQIFPIKRRQKQGNEWVERWSFQTSIDGYRLIASRTGKYRGQTVPLYCGPEEIWKETWLSMAPPMAAKVGVLHADFDQPIYAVALWREYVQTTRDGTPAAMWAKMPSIMIAKVAEALALRKAFPQELSGLYTSEEMDQADNGSRDKRLEATTGTGDRANTTKLTPDTLTPETANDLALLGAADKWDNNGGKQLREVPSTVLEKVKAWLQKRIDTAGKEGAAADAIPPAWRLQLAAVTIVLGIREKEPPGGAGFPLAPSPVATPSSSPAGASSTTSDSAAIAPSSPSSDSATTSSTNSANTPKAATNTTPEPEVDASLLVPAEELDVLTFAELLENLKGKMDNPLMPKFSRAYFSTRIRDDKVKTPLAARVTIRCAALALAIGDELVHCDKRSEKEIQSLLTQPSTYNIEKLAGILRGLRERHPAGDPS